MRRLLVPLCGMSIAASVCLAQPVQAQQARPIDPATIPMPDIAFEPTPGDVEGYDKYFFFHRDDADFETAYADLRECDGYARGLAYRAAPGYVPTTPFTGVLPGAVGGVIGGALADAIHGSAERRRMRRINMRTCMTFKGYSTFGLRKSLWTEFNFEEGNRTVPEDERQHYLQMQARVASGPRPTVGEITR